MKTMFNITIHILHLLPTSHTVFVLVTDEYEEKEKHLEYKAEEVKEEERKSQIERDFQTELRKLMEAEKVSPPGLPLLNKCW